MSNTKDERDVYYIPPNFLTSGRLFGGMIRMRNAIEGCALVVLTGFPIINLPFSLSIRIIILCLITLPLGVFGVLTELESLGRNDIVEGKAKFKFIPA